MCEFLRASALDHREISSQAGDKGVDGKVDEGGLGEEEGNEGVADNDDENEPISNN